VIVKRYLITSALPYASGITHLGNVVGSTLPADIYARFCRLRGRDTLYVCGSDEHGVAITIAAEKEGITPKELVDRFHEANEKALRGAAIDFDVFGRTTSPLHYRTAQDFFRSWMEKGLLSEREVDQFYDEEAAIFLPDRYVEGTCPNCGYDKARGDQCDNCGAYYDQLDLKSPRSMVSGKPPVVRKTKHWYFKLNAFQDWIADYIEHHAPHWKDNVVQQSRSWVKQGLMERTATRDMQWGIPVPVEGADGKVLYVWFEAVLGYISATKQWAETRGDVDAWKQWWQSADTTYTAFLGKDNIVFHTIIFPILLHSNSDQGYILPENVPANEFLNLEGQKFSKSRNWAIDLVQYLRDFPEPQHVDILRYVLTMNMPETRDSDFTWKDYQARVNNELAANLGNYVNRVVQFTHKNFDGKVPDASKAPPTEHETVLFDALRRGQTSVAKHLDDFRFRDAATEAMNMARAANKYFNDKAPWKSIKTDAADAALAVSVCLNAIDTLRIAFAPFLPNASRVMAKMLGVEVHDGGVGDIVDLWMKDPAKATLAVGQSIGEPVILFTRIEDDVVEREVAKLGPKEEKNGSDEKNEEGRNVITIDQFMNVELRTARIISAEAVPKSKKLLKLRVDLGSEQRQVMAGIAQHYSPEELVGMLVVVVANLAPAKLMGEMSEGMILAASNADGTLTLVSPLNDDVGSGATVK
jgi:methionyl-tRNA synthetase